MNWKQYGALGLIATTIAAGATKLVERGRAQDAQLARFKQDVVAARTIHVETDGWNLGSLLSAYEVPKGSAKYCALIEDLYRRNPEQLAAAYGATSTCAFPVVRYQGPVALPNPLDIEKYQNTK
jgi:hypothetical protein